jgi:DNA-binding HxlR family transcriptional regulator
VSFEVRRAADLLERRWVLQVVVAAHSGAVRFNEFGEAVVGISPRMLAARLRDLEQAGMIERNVIPDSPPGVEYRLTERGRALAPLVAALRQYAGT